MLFKIATIAALVSSAAAHMALCDPCPRFSANCVQKYPLPAGVSDYDYSIKNPIPYDGPLTKSDIPWPESATTWTAGQPVTVKFQPGGAAHGGGHCQFSISMDNGKTSAVVHEVLRYCFFNGPSSSNTAEVLEYTFTLPADVPNSDSAVLSWTFVNSHGNREYYSNQANVKIVGSTSKSYTGRQTVVANHAGYPTIPEFGGNYDTGLELYQNAPNVTITPSGYTANNSPPPASSKPAEAASSSAFEYSAASESPAYSAVPSNAAATPAPVIHNAVAIPAVNTADESPSSTAPQTEQTSAAQGSSDECAPGEIKCNDDGSGFRICTWGKWGDGFTCGQGSVCKTSEQNSVYCGWA
ncbi:hypothetical protein IWW50_004232 [Coemansia erecta]|nr:hypothetical protein IWW50_004232 [Coemansia erecta]